MSRISDKSIAVKLNARKLPASFEWRGGLYRIGDIQEIWRLVGAWWDGEGERTFFRIRTDKGGIYELCFDHLRSSWSMSGVQD